MIKNLLFIFVAVYCCHMLNAQDVFNPADAIVTYNAAAAPGSAGNPNLPTAGEMSKWVRTSRVSWNTSNFKCYMWNGMAFRLRFPNNYNPANASKYPVIVFFHGGGETGTVYDNEYHLYWGAQLFEQRINNGEWNGFLVFPQETSVGWDDSYFSRINGVLDTLQKYNNADPDRTIAMGLSSGGYGAVAYASYYPKRVAASLPSSPSQVRSLGGTIGGFVHVPVWIANGGVDANPNPYDAYAFYQDFRNAGGNIYQTYYVNDSHNTWTDMWNQKNASGTYISTTYWNTAHKAQPLVYFENKQFCSTDPISARMGITAGYYAYEWQQNGVTIASATGNEYTATQAGQYRVRFMRDAGGGWSAWSPNPVVISVKTCAADTLYAEHFTNDNYFVSEPSYTIGNFSCQGGIMTSGTDIFTQDATGVQGSRFLVNFTKGGSGCTLTAGDRVWKTYSPVTVLPNTNYEYSFYLGNQDATNTAQIAPSINGTAIIAGYVQAIGTGNTSWKKYSFTWNSGALTYADLGIINRSVATTGNDFVIDEICFKPAPVLPVPGCTANISPANGAVLTTNTTAILNWTAATNAASYDVYLWTGAAAPAIPVATVTTTTYNAAGLTGSTLYKWYVVPKNSNETAATGCSNNQTSFTTAATPVRPGCVTNTSPANGATLSTTTTAALTWSAAATASSYDIYLWKGATAPATATATVTGTTYSATGLTASSTYNWYVVAKNAVGSATGCSANTTRFTTAAGLPVPACVTNTSPANGAKLATTTAALTWSAAATASSYDIYLWKGATAPTTATATVTGKTTYRAVGLTASSVYNWYVVPKNAAGLGIGCNANATRFITAGALNIPGCVSNISPANGSTLATTTTATLTWNAAATATSYDVYLWKGATAPATATATVSGTTYSATGLTASGGYSWYVVPKNVAGSATGCNGNATRFTTAAALNVPGCVTNISPASGSTLAAATTATLTWNAAATATSYDVYLWKGATVPATATATVSGTTYSATGLTAGSLYNWYIVPKNGVGQATGCSANKTNFTTASAPAGGTGDGLKGDYYNSDGLKGSIYLTRTDATVNFDWGTGSPSPVIDANTFSVRWTGLVEPLYSETYTFYTYADEGIRLWVNGRNIINHWKDHSGAEHSATITLTAGAKYEIKMEYNEKKGTALAKLLWSSASTPKAIIPQKQLYLPPLIKIKGRHVKIQEHNDDDDDDDKSNDEHGKDGLKTVIYPNPVITGQFAMVEINSNKGGIAIVQVASITGKALQTHQLNVAPGRNSKTLNTAGLRPGIYVITITGNIDKPVILKLVVH